MSGQPRLRIAQVAPPLERVPPLAYGGTERIVDELTRELVRRGHEVTLFASGDSEAPCRHIPTVPEALRPAASHEDIGAWFAQTVNEVVQRLGEFDVIHSHLEWWSIPLARISTVPVVSTFHGRLDLPFSRQLLARAPSGLVAISRNQASTHPEVPWTVVHNGLTLEGMPHPAERGEQFCFVGRVDPEKGIIEAIEIARRTGRPLRIAAKIGMLPHQKDYYEAVFQPALEDAGSLVEFLGELTPVDRDRLMGDSYATLMPGAWPEPFGLVAIESLACGTPVVARRVGALPEVIREGVDGVFGDDVVAMAFHSEEVGAFDREAMRERVIERFSATRMTDRYEELYARESGRPLATVERIRAGLAADLDRRSEPGDPGGTGDLGGTADLAGTADPGTGRDAASTADRSPQRVPSTNAGVTIVPRRPAARPDAERTGR